MAEGNRLKQKRAVKTHHFENKRERERCIKNGKGVVQALCVIASTKAQYRKGGGVRWGGEGVKS
jgi:hypothetical protein